MSEIDLLDKLIQEADETEFKCSCCNLGTCVSIDEMVEPYGF
jgi:hypothetical protein